MNVSIEAKFCRRDQVVQAQRRRSPVVLPEFPSLRQARLQVIADPVLSKADQLHLAHAISKLKTRR